MAEIGWGHLNGLEKFGRLDDQEEDFEQIPYVGVQDAYPSPRYMHAAHCFLYSGDKSVLWDLYERKAKVMMQLRFDGVLGFPGGLVDPGEGPVEAVNRELFEEAGVTNDKYQIQESDHLVSHLNKTKNLVLHFFAKELSDNDYVEIENGIMKARDYGVETCGIIQAPLYTLGDGIRGLPAFLANKFSGNARQQFLYAVESCKILTKEEIVKAVKTSHGL